MTSPIPTTDPAFPSQYLRVAEQVCRDFYREFPQTDDDYGARGRAYCAHDNAYLIAWTVQAAELASPAILERNVRWLADLLLARKFPHERFVRNLELVRDAVSREGLVEPGMLDAILTPAFEALAAAEH